MPCGAVISASGKFSKITYMGPSEAQEREQKASTGAGNPFQPTGSNGVVVKITAVDGSLRLGEIDNARTDEHGPIG